MDSDILLLFFVQYICMNCLSELFETKKVGRIISSIQL